MVMIVVNHPLTAFLGNMNFLLDPYSVRTICHFKV